jgi:hypothetical protein
VEPERWREVENLYHDALAKEPADREGFLAGASVTEEVRREVASLLAQNTSAGPLDHPAWEMVCGPAAVAETASMAQLASEARFSPGTRLGERYCIVSPVGRGGMGEVYRATDLVLGQTVALKFLPQALTNDVRALNRLYNEVRLARQISHPNVCRVYDIAEADGLRFLTMEYIDGEDLRSLLRRIGHLPAAKATEIARRLCAGVAAAHDCGVLHRDLKPANIMIDGHGNVRITDFGLAVLNDCLGPRDLRSGTPAYMAPEQLAREQVSIRTDIYSLGLVLYEIFGGQNPFIGSSADELLRQKRTTMLPLSLSMDVEPHIEQVILQCLNPDPQRRPLSAAAVAVELAGGDPLAATIAAGETPAPELVARAGATHGLPVRVAFAYLASTIAALILFAWLGPRISILSRLSVDRPDALRRIARETLSRFGLPEGVMKHQVGRFAFDVDAMRRKFDPGALYFWYRASPYWIIPYDLNGIVGPGNPPDERPGMITSKWDGTGRLLYLRALPLARVPFETDPQDVWRRLFEAAGLQTAAFKQVDSDWMPAPGWDARASWAGIYPDSNRTPVRVEAASWRGRPVYFEVMPAERQRTWEPSVVMTQRVSSGATGVFISLFALSAVLAWRNVRLGRGDRRGAFRIAVFIFAGSFIVWAFKANHAPDVVEFTLLAQALTWVGFIATGFWTVYMAFEPYVRRRWPSAIISWTRVLSGKLGDPVVGTHVLIGTSVGAATVAAVAIAFTLAGSYGPRLPSYWILSGSAYTFPYVLSSAIDALLNGLVLLFITFFCKVFFRREWPAGGAAIGIALAVEPPGPLMLAGASLFIVPVTAIYVYLLLRVGLLPVVVAFSTTLILVGLPLTTDIFAPGTVASLLVICGFAAVAVFGFHSTLAGRPLFKLDF